MVLYGNRKQHKPEFGVMPEIRLAASGIFAGAVARSRITRRRVSAMTVSVLAVSRKSTLDRMRAQPGQHLGRVAVRREDGIERMRDAAVADDERDALDERAAPGRKRRQAQRAREFEA